MSFLIWRFNLFTQTSKLNIGGWGIVVIIFTTVFVSRLAKQAAEAMDSELFRQILKSICKVLMPLLAATIYIISIWNWDELLVKKSAFFCYFFWLIYNICIWSVVAVISTVISIISSYYAIKRYYKKLKKSKSNK